MKLTKDQIRQILVERTKNWDFKTLSSLPHPYTLKDCEEASQRIAQAIQKNEKILIVGDYDVDGIISSVIMMQFFELLGYHNVSYIIPNRFEDGYGLSEYIIKQNLSDIIITVDNGITAFEAALFCKMQHIPLIITDHHLPKENLPEATYIINPQRRDCRFPQKEICGAMVTWYFCAGIKIAMKADINIAHFLELVMLATIADMMPLTQINKCVVLYGLKKFKNSKIIPIQKLRTQLKTKAPTAIDISFSLTPLLNAAGRMGEGRIASEFLLAKDYQKSQELFSQLIRLNKMRKNIARAVLDEALQKAFIYPNAVVAKSDDWHEGVLGIVAAQIAEKFQRPAFIFSNTQHGIKGSARSFGNIDLMGMLLGAQEMLGEFGGHSKAAGVSVDDKHFLMFCEYLSSLSSVPQSDSAQEDSNILGEIAPEDIDDELFLILQEFEPFGQANPKPIFQATMQIQSFEYIKAKHQKFKFYNTDMEGIFFFSNVKVEQNQWVIAHFSLQHNLYGIKPIMVIKSLESIAITKK